MGWTILWMVARDPFILCLQGMTSTCIRSINLAAPYYFQFFNRNIQIWRERVHARVGFDRNWSVGYIQLTTGIIIFVHIFCRLEVSSYCIKSISPILDSLLKRSCCFNWTSNWFVGNSHAGINHRSKVSKSLNVCITFQRGRKITRLFLGVTSKFDNNSTERGTSFDTYFAASKTVGKDGYLDTLFLWIRRR